jgi:predicted nucleic acid-binding protein
MGDLCLFVDTNIIIDFLIDRIPFSRQAADLFELGIKGKVKIFISSLCVNNVYYITRKTLGHQVAIHQLNVLSSFVAILDVTESVIKKALASDNRDFEDAIQYEAVLTNSAIKFIVTRDKKGFSKSSVSVVTPSEMLKLVASR